MPDIDDRLQRYLSQIEAGVPKDQVLAGLKEGEQELAALIKLADAMRTISHPLPAPAYSRAARQKILSAVPQTRSLPSPARNPLGWLVFPSLTGAVAILLVAFITLAAFGVFFAGPARAETASVQNIQGVVEHTKTASAVAWTVLSNGEALHSGERIRTAPGSSATLVFSEGSRTRLGAEAAILLSKVDGSWGGDIQVEIEQSLGQSAYDVIPFNSQSAYFKVRTPSGLASVHGTSFSVVVAADGAARVIVENGQVTVSNINTQVLVPAGQATMLQPGKAPEEPGNYFDIVDVVVSIENTQWTVTGQSFQINNQTLIKGAPQVGQLLQIQGRILGNGLWIADQIQPLENYIHSSFTGVLEKITQDSWLVSSKEVIVNAVTKTQDKLDIGASVEVSYLALSDGRWLALQIDSLGNSSEEEETPLTVLATAVIEPITSTVITQTKPVTCPLDDLKPAAQEMAQKYGITYDEIAGWYCQGFSLDEIELAYDLSVLTKRDASTIFGYRSAAMEWEEIYAQLMLRSGQTGPSHKVCQEDAYLPKAQQIADKYGVLYDKVIDLYCQGNSFSNIDLAYSLSKEYSKNIDDIFQQYSAAKNWGQLKKELGDQAAKEEKEPNPNKPDKGNNSNNNNNSDKEQNPNKNK